jgi:hypothetical protein
MQTWCKFGRLQLLLMWGNHGNVMKQLGWTHSITFAVATANVGMLLPLQKELSDKSTIIRSATIEPVVGSSVGAAHNIPSHTLALTYTVELSDTIIRCWIV